MKPYTIVLFIIIVIAAIYAGVAYNGSVDKKSQENQQQQAALVEAAQKTIMDKFIHEDIVVGTGDEAKVGETVTVNYTGTLQDGTVFDSSYKHGQPFSFPLGAGQVIRGWDLGVAGMKVGGKRKLVIPPELGYGAQAMGPIPANSTLTFTVELVSIKK